MKRMLLSTVAAVLLLGTGYAGSAPHKFYAEGVPLIVGGTDGKFHWQMTTKDAAGQSRVIELLPPVVPQNVDARETAAWIALERLHDDRAVVFGDLVTASQPNKQDQLHVSWVRNTYKYKGQRIADVYYFDESTVPSINGDQTRSGTEALGEQFPHMLIDGVAVDYNPALKWYVDHQYGERVLWLEFGNPAAKTPPRRIMSQRSPHPLKLLPDPADTLPPVRPATAVTAPDFSKALPAPAMMYDSGTKTWQRFVNGKWVPAPDVQWSPPKFVPLQPGRRTAPAAPENVPPGPKLLDPKL